MANRSPILLSIIQVCIITCTTTYITACSNIDQRQLYGHTHKYKQKHDKAPQKHDAKKLLAIPNAIPKLEAKSKTGNPKTYSVLNKQYQVLETNKGYKKTGTASWYGSKFHGFQTSSGEIYDMYAMSAAHKTLPLPTYAKITNLENNKSVIVKINDRGPFHDDRLIDLSYAAAFKLGILAKGTAKVEVQAITPDNNYNYQYFLQVGAFRNKTNAESLLTKIMGLINYKKPPKVKIIKQDDFFKLVLGPITSNGQLNNIKSEILAANLPRPMTIIK